MAERIAADGPNPSIASYFKDSKITATPVHRGDPGAPTINFPIPDSWADAGPDTPATAYWAIVDTGPEAAEYTPSIVATLSKLDGDVDPQKLIELAGGATKNLPGFKPHGDGNEDNLGGSPAYQLGGTWTQDGQTKAVADKVVVINGNDNIYLLELNADCLPGSGREGAARDGHHRRENDDHALALAGPFFERGEPARSVRARLPGPG